MNTRTWPYGTTRRAVVIKGNWRPEGLPAQAASATLLRDDHNEMHVCVGETGCAAAKPGDNGTLTFTKGGPTGGYWKFTKDQPCQQN